MNATSFFGAGSQVASAKGKGAMKAAISKKITVPILPPDASDSDRMKFLIGMALAGTSDSKSVIEWKTWITAYTVMLFPPMQGALGMQNYSYAPISTEMKQNFVNLYDAAERLNSEEQPDTLVEAEKNLNAVRVLPGVPLPNPVAYSRFLNWSNDPKVIACHYSLVLFLAGKRLDGEDHAPITQKRPIALMRKAHLSEDVAILTGPLRMSDSSHVLINSAWAESSMLRTTCFTTFAEFSQDGTDEIQDLIYTTMHLLRFSGMQHAKIIANFIAAYPWANDVPLLRTSLAKFVEGANIARKYPAAVQPYIKLIYGDKADIFPRKDMEPLVACAVAANSETSPTLAAFYVSGEFQSIAEAFLAERDRRNYIREARIKKDEKDLYKALGDEKDEEVEDSDYEDVGEAEVAE